MKLPHEILPAAEAEIIDILLWSEEHFGEAARKRYEMLISTAIDDIATNPNRIESRAKPDFGRGTRSWHLRFSRTRARVNGRMVSNPRHVIFYRVESGILIIERVLHDASDAPRHFKK